MYFYFGCNKFSKFLIHDPWEFPNFKSKNIPVSFRGVVHVPLMKLLIISNHLFCLTLHIAHIRDPTGQLHTVHNMRIHLKEMNMQPPSVTLARKMTNDAVGQAQPPHIDGNSGNVITVGSYDLQLSGECSVV